MPFQTTPAAGRETLEAGLSRPPLYAKGMTLV